MFFKTPENSPATQKRADTPVYPYGKKNTIRHKNTRTNNVGAHRCVRPKYTQAKKHRADTPVCPYGKTIRHKNKKTNNVGAQRCVRPKIHTSKESQTPSPALRPSLRFGTPLPIGDVALTRCAIASICIALA